MDTYSLVDPETGKIERMLIGIPSMVAENAGSLIAVENDHPIDDSLFYFDLENQEVIHRPSCISQDKITLEANGASSAELKLPAGTVVAFEGEDFTLEDGEFSFSTDVAGIYQFHLTPPFPWRSVTLEVTANEI